MAHAITPRTSGLYLTSLFGEGNGRAGYEVHRSNFLYSILLHAAALGLLLYLGTVTVRVVNNPHASLNALLSPISLPPALEETGGGGGGARELLSASRGAPPPPSAEQLAPPTVHVLENPKLAAPMSVIVPDNLRSSATLGDLAGVLGPPSDGNGHGSGIGNNRGGGVGPGDGRGVGPGVNAGENRVYHPGGGVTQPIVIHQVEPEFSDEARRAKYQGTVLVHIVIGPDGLVHSAQLASPVGMGLDEKALAAAREWRFVPGKFNGKPVAVYAQIEVSFRLY